MTPKEKAVYIFNKYNDCADDGWSDAFGVNEEVFKENKKQCALICVDEIMEAGKQAIVAEYFDDNYWQEVKQEIKKL